jgi:hypothetical protein
MDKKKVAKKYIDAIFDSGVISKWFANSLKVWVINLTVGDRLVLTGSFNSFDDAEFVADRYTDYKIVFDEEEALFIQDMFGLTFADTLKVVEEVVKERYGFKKIPNVGAAVLNR